MSLKQWHERKLKKSKRQKAHHNDHPVAAMGANAMDIVYLPTAGCTLTSMCARSWNLKQIVSVV